jgi:hypothetical protein
LTHGGEDVVDVQVDQLAREIAARRRKPRIALTMGGSGSRTIVP